MVLTLEALREREERVISSVIIMLVRRTVSQK